MQYFKKTIWLLLFLSLTVSISPAEITSSYIHRGLTLQQDHYSLLEYGILTGDHIPFFVLNQPYELNGALQFLQDSENLGKHHEFLRDRFYFAAVEDERDMLGFRIGPGFSAVGNENETIESPALQVDGNLKIGMVTLVNKFRVDKTLKADPTFHGDVKEWLTGYFDETYVQARLTQKLEVFGGRMGRNFGNLNSYGLILSNYPYAYDHYGFSATGNRFKYSFYSARLNDMLGQDTQGEEFPADTLMDVKRYWAVQRFDAKISENVQIALSEAIIYGGPDQGFVASYLNPVQFYYAAQRNQDVQLNSLWQINLVVRLPYQSAIYLDILVDDLIVNNEEENDRSRYPDRLAVSVKTSSADLLQAGTLTEVTYTRVWNDTYQSLRDYENYLYFQRSMGYPYVSYEGLSLSNSWLNLAPYFVKLKSEFWRRGDIMIIEPFDGEKKEFPHGPVKYGLTVELLITAIYTAGFELDLSYKGRMESHKTSGFFTDAEVFHALSLGLHYYFDFKIMDF